MKKIIYSMALLMGMAFTACSSDSDNNDNVDKYKDRSYGMTAINACGSVVTQLEAANATIASAKLTEAQEGYLRQVLENLVSNVIVPTYTNLANETEALEKTLNGLTVNTITQAQINSACEDFKQARKYWEQSEAFLMGAASDFDIDPTIDSWPLNRSLLLSYFNNGMNDDMLEDATILGFHALEFILFRDGQPRKVAELQGNDTYKNFEHVSGAQYTAEAAHLPVAVCLGRRQEQQSPQGCSRCRSGLSDRERPVVCRQPDQGWYQRFWQFVLDLEGCYCPGAE